MKTKRLLLALLAMLNVSAFVRAESIEDGKAIFTSRCAACHNVNKVLTGPALAGVDQRRSIEWITQFVRSSQTLIKSGDKNAVAVFNQFNNVTMPDHPDLTADNIKSIVQYIRSQVATDAPKGPFAKPGKLQTVYLPLSVSRDYGLLIAYLMTVALLVMLLLFAVRLKSFQANTARRGKMYDHD